jgi:tol-pal system protein YbgF
MKERSFNKGIWIMKARSLKQNYAFFMTTVFAYALCADALRAQESEESDRISYLEEQVRTLVGKMEEVQHTLKGMKEAGVSAPTPTGDLIDKKGSLSQDHDSVHNDADDANDEDEHTLPTGTAQEAYDHAVSLLNKQEYAKAEKALSAFIKKYPKNALVVNAQYWIGETYLLRKEYSQAALHFASAYKTYKAESSSNKKKPGKQSFAKAPEALIKLAFSLKGMGKRKEAVATLAQLHKEFPHLSKNLARLAEKAQTGL